MTPITTTRMSHTHTTPAACQPLEGALRIPVTLIEPSPLNPRKRWNPDKVAGMAADLKANAQIQPIRVRPNPRHTSANGRPPYEIVVGETRWRAAPMAGLDMLDAVVSDCTDHQLIQLALAENTRRQDLHPLEEADAFDALLRKPDGLQGYPNVQDMAAAVGVSPSYVYQRLKLRALCAAGREAFLAGTIDASVALLIARMPSQEEQARATARIVAGWAGEPYSFRQASEFLRKEFMLSLRLARFDTGATYKVAGPCEACPKRSGAAPDLFADVAAAGDLCQDARCYQAKEEEAHQALLQAARDAGRMVLQGAKARAVMPKPDGEPVGHYRLDAPCPALTDSTRPLRALLGPGFATSIVVLDLPGVAPMELVPADVARKAIAARRLLREQTAPKPAPAPAPSPAAKAPLLRPKPQPATPAAPTRVAGAPQAQGEGAGGQPAGSGMAPAAAPARDAAGDAAADEAEHARRVAEMAAGVFPQLVADALGDRLRGADELPLMGLRAAVRALAAAMPAEGLALVWHGMGWTMGPLGYEAQLVYELAAMEQAADGGRRMGELLCLLAVADDLQALPSPEALDDAGSLALALADVLEIDLQAEMRRATVIAGSRLPMTQAQRRLYAERRAALRTTDATEAWLASQGVDSTPGEEPMNSGGLAPAES